MAIFAFLILLNRLQVNRIGEFYLFAGIFLWYFMHQSGIHATISGVLLAFAIPFQKKNGERNPSHQLQHQLHNIVHYGIIPIFALANTGVQLHSEWFRKLSGPNNLGIIFGLVVGKPIGIFTICLAAVSQGWAKLPNGTTYLILLSAGVLAGIGFTMSIFITQSRIYRECRRNTIDNSKIAVLFASILAASVLA